jgi:guanylate kinase
MRALVEADPERFAILTSTVTRPPRLTDENDAFVHAFVSLEQMKAMLARGEVWAPVEYAGNWYGVQKRDAERILRNHIGVIAFVESVVEEYRRQGFAVYTVNVEALNVAQEVTREDEEARAAADKVRAQAPFRHTWKLLNDFAPGGFERSLAQLREMTKNL